MAKNAKQKSLVIVESPAKAKTINRYLGPAYTVMASMGHVRDLPQRRMGVDIEKGFDPTYETVRGRAKLVSSLKKAAKQAAAVYFATDLDREGEAIAWHLAEALGVPGDKAYRVVFNEITKAAIQQAFQDPGEIDMNKVNAQQARRILDRIVGYMLSPLLWKKITKGLSAGRVQSVAVRLVVEREKEIQAFVPKDYWTIKAHLCSAEGEECFHALLRAFDGRDLHVAGDTIKEAEKSDGPDKLRIIATEEEAKAILAALQKEPFIVTGVEKKETKSTPAPPFITSTLQQRASSLLRFSARKTMSVAQQLYEGIDIGEEGPVGLITYMRTDSCRIAEQAIQECRDLIPKEFGEQYLSDEAVHYRPAKDAQAAHEGVRCTSVFRKPEDVRRHLTQDQFGLYELIWKRTVACQMKPALFRITHADITAGKGAFVANGREVLFDGHTVLSGLQLGKDEQILPELEQGKALKLEELLPEQHTTQPPPRFTEASLVRDLERNGIGRPSTYAPIISTIQERGYVRQEKRKFHATDLGILVTDKLVKHFPDILNVEFTSKMEEELDDVEEKGVEWRTVLAEFYEKFNTRLERAKEEMSSEKEGAELADQKCEKCGKPMVVRWSKRGKFLGCSGYPDCEFTLSLDPEGDVVEPETTDAKCPTCESPMVVRHSRRGKFLGCSKYPECKGTRPIDGGDPKPPPEPTDIPCEKCGKPMVIRMSRRGKFLGCSAFPRCRNAKPLPDEMKAKEDKEGKKSPPKKKPELTDVKCSECGAPMVVRSGPRGKFLGCSTYPKCKNTQSLQESD
ncbi:MAG: type I DNA topoisomerase [Planctomycetes bacterium]|nr:type I DNA topoisomerase [Planctomycetota bacterium]